MQVIEPIYEFTLKDKYNYDAENLERAIRSAILREADLLFFTPIAYSVSEPSTQGDSRIYNVKVYGDDLGEAKMAARCK